MPYRIAGEKQTDIKSPLDFPHHALITEPFIMASLVSPSNHLGALLQLIHVHRGEKLDYSLV